MHRPKRAGAITRWHMHCTHQRLFFKIFNYLKLNHNPKKKQNNKKKKKKKKKQNENMKTPLKPTLDFLDFNGSSVIYLFKK
jgi:hypothetical protein